ncbi:hyaluronidase-like [Palaemon carinicauda]|uniref:hyaluronidase-like n=1 Tax=Palaemon carinicauda TaxID=392227 RepID=UPI0035B579DD
MSSTRHIGFTLALLGLCVLSRYMTQAKEFKVYWNVPTFMCNNRGIYINVTKYGIIQNTNDVFQGEKVNIWYHPGKFPHFEGNNSIDGGIPQNGNLAYHISTFTSQVDTMPVDFDGVAVLDFEHYLPSYARAPEQYKEASRDWVSSQHPDWSAEEVNEESERSFNSSIRDYMEVLIWPTILFGQSHNSLADVTLAQAAITASLNLAVYIVIIILINKQSKS